MEAYLTHLPASSEGTGGISLQLSLVSLTGMKRAVLHWVSVLGKSQSAVGNCLAKQIVRCLWHTVVLSGSGSPCGALAPGLSSWRVPDEHLLGGSHCLLWALLQSQPAQCCDHLTVTPQSPQQVGFLSQLVQTGHNWCRGLLAVRCAIFQV